MAPSKALDSQVTPVSRMILYLLEFLAVAGCAFLFGKAWDFYFPGWLWPVSVVGLALLGYTFFFFDEQPVGEIIIDLIYLGVSCFVQFFVVTLAPFLIAWLGASSIKFWVLARPCLFQTRSPCYLWSFGSSVASYSGERIELTS